MILLLIGAAGVVYAEQVSQEEIRQTLKISLTDYFKNPSKAALNAQENRELLHAYKELPKVDANPEDKKEIDSRTFQIISKIQSSKRYKLCVEVYQPVCGIKDGKEITYGNKCKASLEGARIIRKGSCSDKINGVCPDFVDPVCGFVFGNEKGKQERKTFSNKCEAEKAGAVNIVSGQCVDSVDSCQQKVKGIGICDAYFEGYEFDNFAGKCVKKGVSGCSFEAAFKTLEDCQKSCVKKGKVFCTEEERNAICTQEYNPVCGVNPNIKCISASASCGAKTYGNKCTACSDKNIDYWTQGACSDKINGVCPDFVDPVCAAKLDGKKVTYRNSCQAKSNNAEILSSGTCEDLERKECPVEVDPVCGFKGDNGKLPYIDYNNDCIARADGAKKIRKGSCNNDLFPASIFAVTYDYENSLVVSFNAAVKEYPNISIKNTFINDWYWYFGDGISSNKLGEVSIKHTYNSSGTYRVSVTGHDSRGRTFQGVKQITLKFSCPSSALPRCPSDQTLVYPKGLDGNGCVLPPRCVWNGSDCPPVNLPICAAGYKLSYNLNSKGCKINPNCVLNNSVGGDTDAHGCLIAAGYSWCEVKNKCLRLFEEACLSTPVCNLNLTLNEINTCPCGPVAKEGDNCKITKCSDGTQVVTRNGQSARYKKVQQLCLCLSQDTLILSSKGNVKINDLREGDSVWTINNSKKTLVKIIRVSKTSIPEDSKLLHVTLEDGRSLDVSPGHPTVDSTIGQLKSGQEYDKSVVASVLPSNYDYDYTYDILPAGDTGYYWANNILIGSTLKGK